MVQTRTRRARTSAQVVVKGEEARVFPTSGAGQAELLMGDIRSHSDRGRPRLRDRSKSSAYSRSAGRREPALTRGLGEQLRRPALGDVRISALTAEAAFRRGQFPRGIAGGVRRGNLPRVPAQGSRESPRPRTALHLHIDDAISRASVSGGGWY